MLRLNVVPMEMFDYETQRFVRPDFGDSFTLELEHSLKSLAEWEAKYKKPFLMQGPEAEPHSPDEMLDYIRMMTLNEAPDAVYACLTTDNIREIYDYIGDSMTATTFSDKRPGGPKRSREIVTAELIYYWMASYGLEKAYEEWHLNRLLTLLQVFSIKNSSQQKMSKRQALMQQSSINSARRAKYHTRG